MIFILPHLPKTHHTHTHTHTGPPLFTLTPSDLTVSSGRDVTFRCEAVGPPTPSYTWTRAGRTLPSSAVNTGTTLNLFSVSTDDAGVYQCTAGSSRGTVNAQATLTVLCKSPLSLLGGYVFESPAIITSSVKPSSQYGKNARRAFDAMLKRKDRINFYLCIADAP